MNTTQKPQKHIGVRDLADNYSILTWFRESIGIRGNRRVYFAIFTSIIPTLIGALSLVSGLALGADYLGDPGEPSIQFGIIATFPASLIVIFLIPPLPAGDDLIETLYLIYALPLSLIINGLIALAICWTVARRKSP